jgi:hypothetical protein
LAEASSSESFAFAVFGLKNPTTSASMALGADEATLTDLNMLGSFAGVEQRG